MYRVRSIVHNNISNTIYQQLYASKQYNNVIHTTYRQLHSHQTYTRTYKQLLSQSIKSKYAYIHVPLSLVSAQQLHKTQCRHIYTQPLFTTNSKHLLYKYNTQRTIQQRHISIYNKLKNKSQSLRQWILDEQNQSMLKRKLTQYHEYIPFIRTPLLFVKPRPAEHRATYKQQFIFAVTECSVFCISYANSIALPYIVQLSAHHTYLAQPVILIATYCGIAMLLPKLPLPPTGKPGAWYAVLRYFRSLLLVTLFFIAWNVPLVYSVKLWLGILWSDVDSLTRLMNNYDTDILNYIIVQPIIEELVYRGLLFARLCRVIGTLPACLISSSIYATIYSINYKTQSFDYKRYNDVYWFSIVFSLSYRLAGRLYLPIILRCGSSFLVWTQNEAISPLNDDINERREMLSEVLYWLQNNHITPLHDIQTVFNTQPSTDMTTVQNMIDCIFNILDRDKKQYLTADEFTYLFTLQHNIPYILAAAKRIIENHQNVRIDTQSQYSTIYPNSQYIQLTEQQRTMLHELEHSVDKLENQYNPVADQVKDITEIIEKISDTNKSLCDTVIQLDNNKLQQYYSYYYELCVALVHSRVLSSMQSYTTNNKNTVSKQLFTEYMKQRYLLDQGNFYDLMNRLIDIQLYNSPHPLQVVLHGTSK